MERTTIIGIVAAVALAGAECSGTTYYVRKTGSNSNDGKSAANAWATVAYAATKVGSGDVVYVGAGTYTEQVSPTNDGNSSNRIKVYADTSGTLTGDAGTVVLQRGGTVINMSTDDYWTFRGFTFKTTVTGSDTVIVNNCAGAAFEDCRIEGGRDGFNIDGGAVTISNCTITGTDNDGVNVNGGTFTISDSTILDVGAGDEGVQITNATMGLVDSCRIYDGSPAVYLDGGTAGVVNSIIYGSSIVNAVESTGSGTYGVLNCTIGGITQDGVRMNGGTMYVYNNIFFSIGDDCMDLDGGSVTADNNITWSYGSDRSEGFDSNEIVSDPKLVDPAGDDFHVQAGSPAINAGSSYPSSAINDDIEGNARPYGGAWDIGAYEYGAGATPADVPYATDFSSIGAEWENGIAASNGTVGSYIGRYGLVSGVQTSTSLYLNTTPGSTYTLKFDLLLTDSWDGDHSSYGHDAFEVHANGTMVFREYFSHHEFPSLQSYPYAPDATGNWGWGGYYDGRYNDVTVTFVATGDETVLKFIGDANEDYTNEGWGLIAVEVTESNPVFVDVSSAKGFSVNTSGGADYGAGVHWVDLDNDGDLDCFVGGNANYVLGNSIGSGTFGAIYAGSYERGVALADVDGDGDYDLAACPQNPAAVLENLGGIMIARGTLGMDGPSNAEGMVAADVDADGDTDLLAFAENGNWIALNMGAGYSGYSPVGFVDDKNSSDGLNDVGDSGNGDYVSSADVNNDGYLDFFFHYGTGKLFLSDGDGTFTENASGISVYVNNSYKFGSAWGDYDNDGDMDLFAPDARSGNAGSLWRNDGGMFTNVASSAGIASTAAMRAACWGDYDNDGDLDLYVTTAAGTANLLYTNNGDGTFTLDDLGAGLTDDYEDAAFGDFDNDGDLDIALTRRDGDGKTRLLENQTDDTNYLEVRALGPATGSTNIKLVGVRVELLDATGTTLLARREVGTARGYGGTECPWAHFGGVNPASTYTVRVTWPGGDQQSATVVPGAASTTIGSTTIAQMLTIEQQPSGVRFVHWREVAPVE